MNNNNSSELIFPFVLLLTVSHHSSISSTAYSSLTHLGVVLVYSSISDNMSHPHQLVKIHILY